MAKRKTVSIKEQIAREKQDKWDYFQILLVRTITKFRYTVAFIYDVEKLLAKNGPLKTPEDIGPLEMVLRDTDYWEQTIDLVMRMLPNNHKLCLRFFPHPRIPWQVVAEKIDPPESVTLKDLDKWIELLLAHPDNLPGDHHGPVWTRAW